MNNNHSGSNGSIQDIEREIDRDRSHFSETLSALESKLSPGQIVDQALGYAKRNGGDFSDNLVRTVTSNPIPTIITGIGMAWMALNQNSSTAAHQYGHSSSNGSGLSDKLSDAKGKAQGFEDNLSDSAHRASERANQMAGDARHSAQEISARGRLQWERTSRQAVNFFEENPLAIGAAAIAIGTLIGSAIPSTAREKELLGEAGEQMVDEAKGMADSAKKTASEAGRAGVQAAEERVKETKPSTQQPA